MPCSFRVQGSARSPRLNQGGEIPLPIPRSAIAEEFRVILPKQNWFRVILPKQNWTRNEAVQALGSRCERRTQQGIIKNHKMYGKKLLNFLVRQTTKLHLS
ncbi:unnamed protein product [Symbiodinium natans]|uniref:Uncharacterized protein n=1 Tax=Symbiodinium natans TaxID=878477 RepID=A0A812GL75_9DINO|nr:unnamed protein product [Symbiodinium natans]